MSELSSDNVNRLLVKGSGGMGVDSSALALAVEATRDYVRRLGHAASVHAREQHRKTIKDADIARARNELSGIS